MRKFITLKLLWDEENSVPFKRFDQELSTLWDKLNDSYLTPLQIIEKLAKILRQEDAQDDDDVYGENNDGDEYEA